MRGDEAVLCGQQWVVRRWRFGGKHIESRSGDLAGVERACEVLLDDERTASRVDQIRIRFHQREPLRIDESLRLSRERAMQRHHVRTSEKVVGAGELDHADVRSRAARGSEHIHAEGQRDAPDRRADAAIADDAERAIRQFHERSVPVTKIR